MGVQVNHEVETMDSPVRRLLLFQAINEARSQQNGKIHKVISKSFVQFNQHCRNKINSRDIGIWRSEAV